MHLSKRLMALTNFVTPGNRLADIGTDHGYVPIYLAKNNIIPSAIAMDINQGPLAKAREHIIENHLEQKITTRLSDGLNAYNLGEADTILIAGMGGALMSRILENNMHKLEGVSELILQPQSEIAQFRHFLHDAGFKIIHEQMLIDDGKYYVIIKAVHGQEYYDKEVDYIYGKRLLESKDETLYQFLQKELAANESIYARLDLIDSENARERKVSLETKINYGKEACGFYEL